MQPSQHSNPETPSWEEPQKIVTQSKNKDMHPTAVFAPKLRAVTKEQKVAKEAAIEEAQATIHHKQTLTVKKLAAIKWSKQAKYTFDDTPCTVPQTSKGKAMTDNNQPLKKAPSCTEPLVAQELLSKSELSSLGFEAGDSHLVTSTDGYEPTEPSDIEQPIKNRRRGWKKQVVDLHEAVNQEKVVMDIDEKNQVTPKACPVVKQNCGLAQQSVC
jgi:hypothetical protein